MLSTFKKEKKKKELNLHSKLTNKKCTYKKKKNKFNKNSKVSIYLILIDIILRRYYSNGVRL